MADVSKPGKVAEPGCKSCAAPTIALDGATLDPVVSICLITYNHEPYIRECLDSLLM